MDTNVSTKAPCFLALRACTLRLTFVLVIGLGLLVSALVVCLDVYGGKVLQYNQGDVAINQVSNSYCSQVEITVADNQSHFNAYVLPREPEISPKRLEYQNGRQFFMPSWTYQYWGLYLLKDSVVDIHICADQYIMFYVIKGLKSFHEWEQTTLYRGYKQKHRLYPKKNCRSRSCYDHFRIKARETEMYYLLFSSSVGWRFYTKVNMLLEFKRSLYNVSNALHICRSQDGACHLPLEYDSDNTVVVEHAPQPGGSPDIFKQSRVTWTPQPRLSYYLKFFGGIFLCICILTLIYSISRCVVKLPQRQDRYPPLNEGRSKGGGEKQKIKAPRPRRQTRTTLTSYEVVNQDDVEDDEACEQGLSQLNEELNASTTYSSNDQVRDLSMTAAGISAI